MKRVLFLFWVVLWSRNFLLTLISLVMPFLGAASKPCWQQLNFILYIQWKKIVKNIELRFLAVSLSGSIHCCRINIYFFYENKSLIPVKSSTVNLVQSDETVIYLFYRFKCSQNISSLHVLMMLTAWLSAIFIKTWKTLKVRLSQ